jgi:hypothetical protein
MGKWSERAKLGDKFDKRASKRKTLFNASREAAADQV